MDDMPIWLYAIPALLCAGVGLIGASSGIKPILFFGMPVAFMAGIGLAYLINQKMRR